MLSHTATPSYEYDISRLTKIPADKIGYYIEKYDHYKVVNVTGDAPNRSIELNRESSITQALETILLEVFMMDVKKPEARLSKKDVKELR
jgi:hypothetical protein